MQEVAAPIVQPLFGAGAPAETAGGLAAGAGNGPLGHTSGAYGLGASPTLFRPSSMTKDMGGTEAQAVGSDEHGQGCVAGASPPLPTPVQASAPPANQAEFSDYEDDEEDIDPNAPPVVFGEVDLGDMLPSDVRQATEQVDPIRTKADALGLDSRGLAAQSSRFHSARSATPGVKQPKSRMSFTPRLSSPFNNLRLSTPGPSSARARSLSQGSNASITRIDGRSAPAHCPFCDRRYAREIDMQRHVETSCQVAAQSIAAEQQSPGGSSLGLSQGWQYRLQKHVCEVCGVRLSRRDALSRHLLKQHDQRLPRAEKNRTQSPWEGVEPTTRTGHYRDRSGVPKLEADTGLESGAGKDGEGQNDSSSELTDLDYYESDEEVKTRPRPEASSPDTPLAEEAASRGSRKRTLSVTSANGSGSQGLGPLDAAIRATQQANTSSNGTGHDHSPSTGKRQKKTRFWTYSKSPSPRPRPERTPSPMEVDTTPGPSSHPPPSGGATPSSDKGPDAAEREAILRADSLANILDPHRVKCRRCGTVIKLSDKYPYVLRLWLRHKETRGCLAGTGRTAPWPKRQGPGNGDGASGGDGGSGTAPSGGSSANVGNGLTDAGASGDGSGSGTQERAGGGSQDTSSYSRQFLLRTPDKSSHLRLFAASPSPPPSLSDMETEEEERKPIIVDGVAIPPTMQFDKNEPLTLFSQRMPAVDWVQRNEAHARELGLVVDEVHDDGELEALPATGRSQAAFASRRKALGSGNTSDSSGDVPLMGTTRNHTIRKGPSSRETGRAPSSKAAAGGRPIYHLSTVAREESVPLEWEVGMSGRKRKRRIAGMTHDDDEGYESAVFDSDSDSEYESRKARRPHSKHKHAAKSKPKAQTQPRKRKRGKHQTPAGTFRRGRPPKHEQPMPSASTSFLGLETLDEDVKIEPAELAPPMSETRCPHCKAKFGRPADVRRHVAYICPALEGKRSLKDCTCSRCGAVMARPDALERHHKSAFDCVDGTPRTVWPMGRPEPKPAPKVSSRRRRR